MINTDNLFILKNDINGRSTIKIDIEKMVESEVKSLIISGVGIRFAAYDRFVSNKETKQIHNDFTTPLDFEEDPWVNSVPTIRGPIKTKIYEIYENEPKAEYSTYEKILCKINIRPTWRGEKPKTRVEDLNGQIHIMEVMWKCDKDEQYPGEYALKPADRKVFERWVREYDIGWIASGDVKILTGCHE